MNEIEKYYNIIHNEPDGKTIVLTHTYLKQDETISAIRTLSCCNEEEKQEKTHTNVYMYLSIMIHSWFNTVCSELFRRHLFFQMYITLRI